MDFEGTLWTDQKLEFNWAFWTWLRTEHPDIALWMTPTDRNWLPGGEGPATDMTIALEYVDEFIAQSPDYPIETP